MRKAWAWEERNGESAARVKADSKCAGEREDTRRTRGKWGHETEFEAGEETHHSSERNDGNEVRAARAGHRRRRGNFGETKCTDVTGVA